LVSTPPSAESDPASDDDTVGGPPPRRKLSAPRLSHHRQGLLQEPGPSRWSNQHAPRSSLCDAGAGSHSSCKLAQDRRSQTAARGEHNCPAVTSTPPLSPKPTGERADRHAGGMQLHQGGAPFRLRCVQHGAQAHASCNRHAGYYVRETAPSLAPVPRLLDCGTGAATRGNPAHGPTVPTEHIGHGSVRRRRRRDGRYGQKWAGSNGGGRRAEAAVKSSVGSRPLLG
jgi:hypothetical protein